LCDFLIFATLFFVCRGLKTAWCFRNCVKSS